MDNLRQNLLTGIGLTLVVTLAVGHFYLQSRAPEQEAGAWHNDWLDQPDADRAALVPEPVIYDAGPEAALLVRTALDIRQISDELSALLEHKQFGVVNDELLQVAAEAVESGDDVRLGGVLSLLGQLSIEEQDFDSAEVYLLESLDVYERAGDTVGGAQAQMHLGRMHLKRRQRARTAGQAYDRVLLARWQISHGQYDSANQNLQFVINENLSINRFGAAASAYNSLARLHSEAGDPYSAEQAAMEAAQLYAASGQLYNAHNTIARLQNAGVESWRLFEIEQAIDNRFAEFTASTQQLRRAEDYQRLYHYYRSQGDEESAWRLRLQASASLGQVSRREMYHRIPDVLALLYVSNDDKDRAHDYFQRASETFDVEGLEELWSQTEQLRDDIL